MSDERSENDDQVEELYLVFIITLSILYCYHTVEVI